MSGVLCLCSEATGTAIHQLRVKGMGWSLSFLQHLFRARLAVRGNELCELGSSQRAELGSAGVKG